MIIEFLLKGYGYISDFMLIHNLYIFIIHAFQHIYTFVDVGNCTVSNES